jgi:aspartyl aminopeptidase
MNEDLKRKTCLRPKNAYDIVGENEKKKCEDYCRDYCKYLNASKTEREAVKAAVSLAEKEGFRPYVRGEKLLPGDKIYSVNRDKALMLAVIGRAPLDKGVNIAAAHIDSPRLDLKQAPLYEDSEIAYFKTHYYGGIRKSVGHRSLTARVTHCEMEISSKSL